MSLGLPRSKEVMLEVANRSLSREEGGASGLITSESTCGHKSNCKTKEIGLFEPESLPTPEVIISSVTVSPENSSRRRKSLLGVF